MALSEALTHVCYNPGRTTDFVLSQTCMDLNGYRTGSGTHTVVMLFSNAYTKCKEKDHDRIPYQELI